MAESGWPKIPINSSRLKLVRIVGIILCFTQVILLMWLFAQILILYWTVGEVLTENSNISRLLKKDRLKKSVYKGWSIILWTHACLLLFSILLVKQVFEKVDDDLTDVLWKGLHEYSQGIYWSERIDKVQKTLSCCGVNSPEDWLQTDWISQSKMPLKDRFRSSQIGADIKPVPLSCCLVDKPAPCLLEAVHGDDIGLVEEPSNLAFESGCTQILAHRLSTFSRICIINLTLLITNVIFGWLIQKLLLNLKEGIKNMEGFEYTWIFSPLPSSVFGKKIKSVSSQAGFTKNDVFHDEVKEFKLAEKLEVEPTVEENEEKENNTEEPCAFSPLLINLENDKEITKCEYDNGKSATPRYFTRSAADCGFNNLGLDVEKGKCVKVKPGDRTSFATRNTHLVNSSSDSDNTTKDNILDRLKTDKQNLEPIDRNIKEKLRIPKSLVDESEIKNQWFEQSFNNFNEIASSSSYEINTPCVDIVEVQPFTSNLSRIHKNVSLNKARSESTLKTTAISKYISSYFKDIFRTYFSKHDRKFKDDKVLDEEITNLIPEGELYENESFQNSEEILETQESIGYDEEELQLSLDDLFDDHAEINLMNFNEGSSKLNAITNYEEEKQSKIMSLNNYDCEKRSKAIPLINYGGGDSLGMSMAKTNDINHQNQMEIMSAAYYGGEKISKISYLSHFGAEHSKEETVGSYDHEVSKITRQNYCGDNILRPFVVKPFLTESLHITKSPIDKNIKEEITNYGLDKEGEKEKETNNHENMDILEDQDENFHESMDIDDHDSEVSENFSINLLNQDFQDGPSITHPNSQIAYCFQPENSCNTVSDFTEDFASISSNEDETQISPRHYENPFGKIKSEFESKNLLAYIRKERLKEIQNKSTPHVDKLIEKFNLH